MSTATITALLIGWTAIGVLWWIIAAVLVARAVRVRATETGNTQRGDIRISIFKPVPSPLGENEFAMVRECLETVVADLDANSELLLGGDERERTRLVTLVEHLRAGHPEARIELLVARLADTRMHPKVAWNRELSRLATGDYWFWSDVDMRQPPGTIHSLRADVAGHAGMVTSPYVVSRVDTAADMLDALFVNLEFYPGVELLGRVNRIPGGFGAGMLFAAEDFRHKVDWDELGSYLAEDFELGNRLAPVRLASTRLSTVPSSSSWRAALLHYVRWQKTVRWCQPGGFASQIVVLPVIGWLVWLLSDPGQSVAWFGLGTVVLADTFAAVVINRLLGCAIGPRQIMTVPLWSLLRGITWVACWLPWPVVWRGRRFWSARLNNSTGPAPSGREALK